MRKMLFVVAAIFAFPTYLLANDTYDPATGIVHMPIVKVGDVNYEVNMMHLGNLVFSVTSANPIAIPERFSMEWLSGKTLYAVMYEDSPVIPGKNDVSIVAELVFNGNGTSSWTGLVNSDSGSGSYNVDENGNIVTADGELLRICGSTSEYLIVEEYDDGEYDHTEWLFFNKEDAMNAAKLLYTNIPPCS